MKLEISQLKKLEPIHKVIIQSLDLALYRLQVEHNGESFWVVENDSYLKRHSLMEMRELMSPLSIQSLVLRHESAYDEMIGQPVRDSNQLEIPLSQDLYAIPEQKH